MIGVMLRHFASFGKGRYNVPPKQLHSVRYIRAVDEGKQ